MLNIKQSTYMEKKYISKLVEILVMVEGPAVGKAGDCLDWIAGGLERMNSKILVTSVRFGQRPRIFDKFSFVLK